MVNVAQFLNQAHASCRPGQTWFVEIDFVQDMYMCVSVCLPPRLLIISGMAWCDMDPSYMIVKQVLQFLYGSRSWCH